MSVLLDCCLVMMLVCAHAPLLAVSVAQLRRGIIPATWQFGTMGIALYYDLGIVMQVAGVPYRSAFFPSLHDAGEEGFVLLVLLVMVSPYLLWCGSRLAGQSGRYESRGNLVRFAPRMAGLFVLLIVPASVALGAFGVHVVWGATSIASIKREWVSTLGSSYVMFMVPMFALSFLIRADIAYRRAGRVLVFLLVACSMGATLFLGQRTMTLLPVLFLFLFYFRFRLRRLVAGVALLLLFAAGMLWFYKGYAVQADQPIDARLVQVLNDDFARANVLLRAIQEAETIGTRVLPFPGQGYLHAATLYVPRRVFPQKGYSTAAYFTGMAVGQDAEYLSWGLGVGFLEQLALTFGVLALVPGVMLYGMLLGFLDRLREYFPGTLVGVCLGSVWMSGYDASAIVLYHGSMVVFAVLLELVFSAQRRNADATYDSPSRLLPPAAGAHSMAGNYSLIGR